MTKYQDFKIIQTHSIECSINEYFPTLKYFF